MKKALAVKASQAVKITPPRLKYCLQRERIFSILDEASTKPVVWVNGPPGEGKTWAVASFLGERNIKPLWYQIDERDADPATFVNFFSLAIRKLSPRYRKKFPNLTPEYFSDLVTFSRNYFEQVYEALSSPFVVVFDNYQTIPEDVPLQKMLSVATELLPDWGRMIFISRESPSPEFARMQASQSLSVINSLDLNFTRDETEALLCKTLSASLQSDTIDAIHKKYHGWVAGMILQIQQDFVSEVVNGELDSTPEVIFSFLTEEVFSRMRSQDQEILLQAALLPQMSYRTIDILTGSKKSSALLKRLYNKGYFITRHSNAKVAYQFHPMFREFLLEKGKATFSDEERRDLQSKAAALLLAEELFDDASDLIKESQDWAALTEFILSHGQRYVEQGRYQSLLALLHALPQNHLQNPWILYWTGMALMPGDQQAAQDNFEKALILFEKKQLLEGICLSWAGIVDTIIITWNDHTLIDKWIAWMAEFLAKKPKILSPELTGRITFGMFCALAHRSPEHPDMEIWSQRVALMFDSIPDDNHRIAIVTRYMIYLQWMGEFSEVKTIIDRFHFTATSKKVEPINLLAWLQTEAMYYWLTGDFSTCASVVKKGLALADKSGIRIMDFQLLMTSAYLSLESADSKKRRQALNKVLSIMDENGRLYQAHFNYLAALEALLVNEPQRALIHIQKSLDEAAILGAPFPEALSTIGMVRVLTELGNFDAAEPFIARADEIASGMKSTFLIYSLSLAQAELAFARQQEEAGKTALTVALAAGKKMDLYYLDWWRSDIMTDLFIKALENDIEVDYAQSFIRKRQLVPKKPPLHLQNWPWQIKIFTFGRFGIVIDEKPVRLNGKGQKKTLELLFALIALGGREVQEEKLSDILWPDSEGDAAHSAFTSTLYRLRKIIPADALVVNNGKLSLNDRRCWLDSWAFERNLAEINTLLAHGSDQMENALQKTQQTLSLYNGPFLANDVQEGWIFGPRERLLIKLLRVIEWLIVKSIETDNYFEVISLYDKALEFDPLSEEYYRGLMKCYIQLGDRPKALSVYIKCRNQLITAYNLEPSVETQALYQQILST